MDISLFQKLCMSQNESVSVLKKQYRMNIDIQELSNTVTYGNVMTPATREVAMQKLEMP